MLLQVDILMFNFYSKNFRCFLSKITAFSNPHTWHAYNITVVTSLSKNSSLISPGKSDFLPFQSKANIALKGLFTKFLHSNFKWAIVIKYNTQGFETMYNFELTIPSTTVQQEPFNISFVMAKYCNYSFTTVYAQLPFPIKVSHLIAFLKSFFCCSHNDSAICIH